MITIQKIELPLPGMENLLSEALAEGYCFIQTLVEQWDSAENRFDAPGEVLCGHLDQGLLVAVGALNIDPFAGTTEIGRIRKIYVRPAWRNKGVGRTLVTTLVEQPHPLPLCTPARGQRACGAPLREDRLCARRKP